MFFEEFEDRRAPFLPRVFGTDTRARHAGGNVVRLLITVAFTKWFRSCIESFDRGSI